MSKERKIIDERNENIIEKYLNRYRHSSQSVSMRRSCLNYFFKEKYFGYNEKIGDIRKSDLMDYFDYLNQLESISLKTKINKWRILRSFLNYCMEYFDDFLIKIPENTISWRKNHKEPNSNKDEIMTLEEVKDLLNYIFNNHFQYYIIFRMFAETGMRKGELISIEIDAIDLDKRTILTKGKVGKKSYYFSAEFTPFLRVFIENRKKQETDLEELFISSHKTKFSKRTFNQYLKRILLIAGINKNITCHSFRRTVNTLRKKMGCQNEDRRILINHSVADVNFDSYVKFNYSEFIELYDKWYPYSEISI